ncbi:MAG: response regulator [Planctomycetota bacterium]|nr:MAG: response regulator [Planctomycetota bacterium]
MSEGHVGNLAAPLVHRILLVEDNEQTRKAIRDFLKSRGFDVITARDGGQCHSAFQMRKPDFVILDLILPGQNGFELCNWMKRHDETVPILVLSVIDLPESRDLATRAGADGYLIKPVDTSVLLATIHSVAEEVWAKFHGMSERDRSRIRFSCPCGKRFRVSASHRGRTLTCPDCGEPLTVPHH